jgi:hypothetical protein
VVERLSLSVLQLLRDGKEIFARFPIRALRLDLRNTGVNDAIARELIGRARDCPHLAWLDLRSNGISAGACARLKAAFGRVVRYSRTS